MLEHSWTRWKWDRERHTWAGTAWVERNGQESLNSDGMKEIWFYSKWGKSVWKCPQQRIHVARLSAHAALGPRENSEMRLDQAGTSQAISPLVLIWRGGGGATGLRSFLLSPSIPAFNFDSFYTFSVIYTYISVTYLHFLLNLVDLMKTELNTMSW